MAVTMVPPPEVLPDVLPCGQLSASGQPMGELRSRLRHVSPVRGVATVAWAWVQIVGVVVVTVWVDHWAVWIAAMVVQARAFALLGILGHESAHRLLLRSKRANDAVGRWLCSYPSFTAHDAYRRVHMAHHRDALGANEPDARLYAGYPSGWASLRRKLTRDAVGISGYKNLLGLLRALRSPTARPVALRIIGAQMVLLGLCVLWGHPWVYLLLWFVPWMTGWRVLNRLRAIAEHGGMTASTDHRRTTHHVRQTWLARFWIVPYHTGYHLAHHTDPGVPWTALAVLHRELVAAGWVTDAITWPSYRALWRALALGR